MKKSSFSIALKTYGIALLLSCVFSGLLLFPPSAAQSQIIVAAEAPPARLNIGALHGVVTVRRDGRGVPYIEAQNESDLYTAQGYVTASDRLWQMDLLRRTARGELSEIFGAVTLEGDKLHRRYGFTELAGTMMSALSPPVRSSLESYARGVNAYIQACDEGMLPAEFRLLKYKARPWQPEDSLLVGKLFAETLSTSWQVDVMLESISDLPEELLRELLPETSPLDVVIVGSDGGGKSLRKIQSARRQTRRTQAGADVFDAGLHLFEVAKRSLERVGLYVEGRAASNNWVISGRRGVSGKPLRPEMTHTSTPPRHLSGI